MRHQWRALPNAHWKLTVVAHSLFFIIFRTWRMWHAHLVHVAACGSGGRADWLVIRRLLVQSSPPPSSSVEVSLSKTPHPDCSWQVGLHLAWLTLPSVWMCAWMGKCSGNILKRFECRLVRKAPYKCSPFKLKVKGNLTLKKNIYTYIFYCCQLNALLTAFTQTNFNGVHFCNKRLTGFFYFIFFYPFIDGQC